MSSSNLLKINNVGEFAFTLSVFAFLLFIPALIIGSMLSIQLKLDRDVVTQFACVGGTWILLQIPLILFLYNKSKRWGGVRRGSKQIVYFEMSSVGFILILRIISGGEDAGGIITGLKIFFILVIMVMLFFQIFTHCILRYKILKHDLLRWIAIGAFSILNIATMIV